MAMHGMLAAGLAALALTAGAKPSPVKLMLPKTDATVRVQTDGQRAFFDLPDEERRTRQGDASTRAEWVAVGWHPEPVVFVWDGIKSRKCDLRFRIWREEDDACVCDTNFLFLTTGRFTWDNFRIGTAYRWSLDVKGKGSATSRFVTEDRPPRFVRVPGVPNMRDLGGWRTADGRRVRQGLVYRSANLCENSCECAERPPRTRLTPETCHYMTNALAIRTELDLRGARECEGLFASPLGPSVCRVQISSGCYGTMTGAVERAACLAELRLIADARNLPLLFHCSSGQDRTGTLAFVVNGLLGVASDDLARDWDATVLWNNEHDWFNRNNSYAALLKVMDAYPGATLNERIAAYAHDIGFTDADIARLRATLLED